MNGSWQEIAKHLEKVTGQKTIFSKIEPLSGGCINQSWKVTDTDQRSWFIKTNKPFLEHMFSAEFKGLYEIKSSKSIRTPTSYCFGTTAKVSYLVLEYIPLTSTINAQQAGEQLAQMHQCYSTSTKPFGWSSDNTIGSTSQPNKYHQHWDNFYKEERLLFQLKLARDNGYSQKAYDSGLLLSESIHHFFSQYKPKPSLLHGDLWGGNCAADKAGNTVIFDPAIYYGDREADIAMTELFGGFTNNFYSSYNYHYPLNSDYKTRKTLYNLYHILNHFNLFSGSYASQAESMTEKLLSEV